MSLTAQQTHVRAYKVDKTRLGRFMRKHNIKSQAKAIRIIFARARI